MLSRSLLKKIPTVL